MEVRHYKAPPADGAALLFSRGWVTPETSGPAQMRPARSSAWRATPLSIALWAAPVVSAVGSPFTLGKSTAAELFEVWEEGCAGGGGCEAETAGCAEESALRIPGVAFSNSSIAAAIQRMSA